MGPCCEQTHAAFEVGLSLDQGQGVYSGWSDVVVSSQLRLCHTCIIDVMKTKQEQRVLHPVKFLLMWRAFCTVCLLFHDDVIKWKHFPRYWPFVRGIHRSPVNSPHKGQWRGAFMFSLVWAWINGWANNREAGGLRLHRTHYDVTVMWQQDCYRVHLSWRNKIPGSRCRSVMNSTGS